MSPADDSQHERGCLADANYVRAILVLPETLGMSKEECVQAVGDAYRIILDFATRHGWQKHTETIDIRHVEIVANQDDLLGKFEIDEKAKESIPEAFMAGIERRRLALIIPSECARMRPQYAVAPNFWTRLIAHELAHELHLGIVNGEDSAMGPRWFYEGFATIAAGQGFERNSDFESVEEALSAIRTLQQVGGYRKAAEVLRYFMRRTPLSQLVEWARKPAFEERLREAERSTE